MTDIKVNFAGIEISNPVFTASGTCGYADELGDFMDMKRLGGFITKSITALPRKGNPTPRIVETDAGMLNAIGLANIGLERFIDEKMGILRELGPAVFVNVAGETIDDYAVVVERLRNEEAISGFELNISCPNVKKGGISFGVDPVQIEKITSVVKDECGDKVLMVKLSPSVTDIGETANAAVDGGADALSLVNTFTAMVIDVERQRAVLANRTGGLSGPAIKPMAVHLVNKVYNEVGKKRGVPIMGVGGIRTGLDAIEFMLAGASVVSVGCGSFVEPDCCVKVLEGMKKYCERKGIGKISELTGALES